MGEKCKQLGKKWKACWDTCRHLCLCQNELSVWSHITQSVICESRQPKNWIYLFF